MHIPGNSDPDTYSQQPSSAWFNAIIKGQSDIIEMITRGDELHQVLGTIASLVEQHSDNECYASILLAAPEGDRLLHGAAPGMPEAFCQIINGLPVGDNQGSCGTAAFLKTTIIVENTATDPRIAAYRDVAERFGLKACWSKPLLSRSGQLLGTFAIYYKQTGRPSQRDEEVVHMLSSTTVLAIEYMQADAERQRLLDLQRQAEQKAASAEELAEVAAEGSRTGTFLIDLATDHIRYSPSFLTF
ncbi:GAF domain-containing protein [Chitinophaga horti]|uniref:GAF domain-containing protein n=1 Tax=Chitinophaga horti TaxID=2920382 RepID=A0ABY6J7Q9_9BACT|nr:GAF domain-containing protein [Chitinophaga horti]UYQ94316.1 GAF domain-containing protein [Chitinophaga horti]